jgi:hypothetical protein
MRTIANITVGHPDTVPSKPSHTWGVRQGNRPHTVIGKPGSYRVGHRGAGRPSGKATLDRSTGINAARRKPIDPNSPILSPA